MARCSCTCGTSYQFADTGIGKKARCKQCGAVFVLTDQAADVIPFAKDEPTEDFDEGKLLAPSVPTPAGFGSSQPVEEEDPAEAKTFGYGLLRAVWVPVHPLSLWSFVTWWVLLSVDRFLLPHAHIFGAIAGFVILGWYCAFRFEVIVHAAGGRDELPEIQLSDGYMDGIFEPAIQWIGSWALVLLPMLAALAGFAWFGGGGLTGILGEFAEGMRALLTHGISGLVHGGASTPALVLMGLMLAGLFFWPMVALCIGIGGFDSLVRIDLIVSTMMRTLPVYLLVVGLVLLADLLRGMLEDVSLPLIGALAGVGVSLYLELVALQVIGLYYHHFKDRFAWSWD